MNADYHNRVNVASSDRRLALGRPGPIKGASRGSTGAGRPTGCPGAILGGVSGSSLANRAIRRLGGPERMPGACYGQVERMPDRGSSDVCFAGLDVCCLTSRRGRLGEIVRSCDRSLALGAFCETVVKPPSLDARLETKPLLSYPFYGKILLSDNDNYQTRGYGMNKLTTKQQTDLAQFSPSARRYISAGVAKNTKRTYRAQWSDFTRYCAGRGLEALPASVNTVVEYLATLADKGASLSKIRVARSAIAWVHRTKEVPDPTTAQSVTLCLSGIAREIGRPPAKKTALSLADIRAMVDTLPRTARGKRDRALLLVGFAGGFRRSELVALTRGDVRINGDLKITVARGKTDQSGKGSLRTIPRIEGRNADLCPVQALQDWLEVASITSGFVFRTMDKHGNVGTKPASGRAVARLVQTTAKAAGLDYTSMAAHSLRSGFVTTAREQGAQLADVVSQTKQSYDTALGYDQGDAGATRAVKAVFEE